MKHVRSFLLFLAAAVLVTALSGTPAVAQGKLANGGGGEFGTALAAVDTSVFTLNANMRVRMQEWDTTTSPLRVGANKTGYKVFQFVIRNYGAAADTLQSVEFLSFNDKDFSTAKISLFRTTSGTPLASITNPGAFSENTSLTFSGFNSVIAAADSGIFYFTFDSDPDNVDTTYEGLYVGLKVIGGGITMAQSGQAPSNLTDTLMYDTGTLGYGSGGRLVAFDTKPPDLLVQFDLATDNGGGCINNNVINLGDSIEVVIADTVGAFEIDSAWANLAVFGSDAATPFTDTILFNVIPNPDDSGMLFGWLIPDTSITPALDVASGFYYLVVTAQDLGGNQRTDSILINYAIDNQKPIFDSVYVSLYYDANGDGIAAIGDTVLVKAVMTSNAIGEVTSVYADMSNWGYGAVPLLDQSNDRKFISKLELTAGALDIPADSSDSRFWVYAQDNACNSAVDSSQAAFAIDNQPPGAPTITYARLLDVDSNNVINIGDSVKITVDPTADDLASTCEVMVDLLTSGLGGIQEQCIEDTTAAGVYTFSYKVKTGGAYAVDVGASTHYVVITLTDDAGNAVEYNSPAILQPVDTDPPKAVADLVADKGPCAIELDWDAVSLDDSLYIIFWDNGDGWTSADTMIDAQGRVIFLDTLGAADVTNWTTDGTVTLEHGKTYQFVVRAIDDANNREYNFNRVSQVADCQPPVACATFPAEGGSFGVNNPLNLVAESTYPDVDNVYLYVRDADQGSGTPGPWNVVGPFTMTQVGGSGGVFTYTLDSTALDGLGLTGGYLDDTYELVTVAQDEVGNIQSIDEAIDSCGLYSFHWFWQSLPVVLVAVNDTVSPQSSCGYNVTRDNNNTVEIDVSDYAAGDTFTVDVWVIYDITDSTRVGYYMDVAAMPYTFNLDATQFPKGTQYMWVKVTRDDGNVGYLMVPLCVPDENAPEAMIVYPIDGSWVPRDCNALDDTLQVWAMVDPNTYDPNNITKVEFYSAPYGSETWTLFDVVTVPEVDGDVYYGATWDNCSYEHGDTVKLRAIFYDDAGNTYTTASVMVFIDAEAPDIQLTVPQAKTVCDVDKVSGTIDLYATVTTTHEDIVNVTFYYALADSPDIFKYYHEIGEGEPANNSGIYVYRNFDTEDDLVDGKQYRFRAIATDVGGNVMWDYDGDHLFDDNTFDPATKSSDMLLTVDNSANDGYISSVQVKDGEGNLVHDFQTPVLPINREDVYTAMGNSLTVNVQLTPAADTCGIVKVVYYWNENQIAVGASEPPYSATFDPVALGFVDPEEVQDDDYVEAELGIEITDVFGNTDGDAITVYVLDTTANQAVIAYPDNQQCVAGQVTLFAIALNSYDLHHVEYRYRVPGGDWVAIGSSTDYEDDFPVAWNTLNAGIPDGTYELAAVAVDNSFNEDTDPKYITVHVANGFATAELTSPDDLDFITLGQVITAEVTSGTPERIEFLYKSSTSGSWITFATDYFAPWSAEWNYDDEGAPDDGYYNFKVRTYNCAGNYKESEWRTFFYDGTDPRAILTSIDGQDVENYNDPCVDLTGKTEIVVTGSFFDDLNEINNSGIAKVGFLVKNATGDVVLEKYIDPATAGSQSVTWDISSCCSNADSLFFQCVAYDNVGNIGYSAVIKGCINDETAPTTAIAGFYNCRLYGYDWSGDVASVLFERQSGDEWIGIGVGHNIMDGLYYTDWSPAPGNYTLRMKAADSTGNYDESLALTATFTFNADSTFSFVGTGLGTVAARKNFDDADLAGVVGVTSTPGKPFVFAVYYDGSYVHEILDMKANLDDAADYVGSFDASSLEGDGEGFFFASVPAATGSSVLIQYTSITTHEVTADFGTNGTVKGLNNTVQLSIPPGATPYMTAVILETWIPQPGPDQDALEAIGNNNGYGIFVGCNGYLDAKKKDGGQTKLGDGYYNCPFDYNKLATITMPYSAEVNTPPESLLVCWWNDYDNEWEKTEIHHPVFNTTAHTVQFQTEGLHGLYAVIRLNLIVTPSPLSISMIGQSYCDYFPPEPTLKFRITDYYAGVDEDWFTVAVDRVPIVLEGEAGLNYSWTYDDITGTLCVYWDSGYGESCDDCGAEPLACGQHVVTVVAKNQQSVFDSASYVINVDCAPPTVTFDNSYVGKNPTIRFNVTDEASGVDLSSLHVDVIAVQTEDTNVFHPNQYEQLFFLQTFFPQQIAPDENGDVVLTTSYDLEDERAIVVVIYDGHRSVPLYNGDPVSYGDWDAYYSDHHGINDCVGNVQTPVVQILAIDVDAPHVTVLGYDTPGNQVTALPGTCPVRLQLTDDGAGFAAADVKIYEDGTLLTPAEGEVDAEGEYSFNATTGIVLYCPTAGKAVEFVITDRAGNIAYRAFAPSNPAAIVNATLTQNPWDPKSDGNLTIDFGYEGPAVVSIYDFGGDLVRTINTTNGAAVWNGMTEDGTRVANGVYFAHIVVESNAGSFSSVVKIAIVEK